MILISTIILLFVSFLAKGVMDKSSENDYKSSWWNKTESWQNKYALPFQKGSHWYYFGLYKPKYKEKFPFSTTALVMFTDGWHLAQFVFLNSFMIALAINTGHGILSIFFDYLFIRLIYIVSFKITYGA